MPRFFLLLVCALTVVATANDYSTPEWKREIAAGYVPYKKLALSDFRVDDNHRPRTGMYTHGFTHYDYKYRWTEQNGNVTVVLTKWIVRSGLDRSQTTRRSWFKDHDRILPHEQLHLDINELHSRALATKSLSELPVGTGANVSEAVQDLRTQLTALIDQVTKQAQEEQNRYDRETGGGSKAGPQSEWNRKIGQRVRAAGISY